MGYSIRLKSFKEIKEDDIDFIIYHLPDYLRGPYDTIKKQSWGWPCVCDILLPKGNIISITGASEISGKYAKEFCYYIQHELDKLGYDTNMYYSNGIIWDMNKDLDIDDISKDLPVTKIKKKEIKSMRVMISQPMNGRRNDDIKKEREEIIEQFKKLHIEVIDSLIEDTADPRTYNEYHPALYYLARSIELMGQVDAVYFVDGWQNARGCRIERQIAEEYNIKILETSFLYPTKKRNDPFSIDPNGIRILPCGDRTITKPDYTITAINNKPYNDNAIRMLENKTVATEEKHIPRLD